jgi:flagellar protein FlaG
LCGRKIFCPQIKEVVPSADNTSVEKLNQSMLVSGNLAPRSTQGDLAVGYQGKVHALKGAEAVVSDVKVTDIFAEKLVEAVQDLRNAIDSLAIRLAINIEKKDGRFIVRVVDQETGELIRQIPSEEFLKMAAAQIGQRGRLFSKEV